MTTPWIKKYSPKNSAEIINQTHAIEKIKYFVKKYPNTPKKALLLYGPPGVGKTSSIYAIAREYNYEIVELNASDVRSAKMVHSILDEAIKGKPFFHKGRIILIDEIDGMSGREDKGGLAAMINIINQSKWPIILTANDPWDPKFKKLRDMCELIEFKKLSTTDIFKALKRISSLEGINIDESVLKTLAERSQGDLRSAINDLQILSNISKKVTLKDLNILGYREREKTIFQALGQMFKATTITSSTLPFSEVDMDPEEIVAWIEENIPNEYEDIEEIYKAYEWMSKADTFYSNIYRRQYWGLLKYYTTLTYAGVALSKKKRYRKFTRYQMPNLFRRLSRTKEFREYVKNITKELKSNLHASTKRIWQIYINTLIFLLRNDEKMGKKYGKSLGLKESQLEYIDAYLKRL